MAQTFSDKGKPLPLTTEPGEVVHGGKVAERLLEPLHATHLAPHRAVDEMMAVLVGKLVDPLAPVVAAACEQNDVNRPIRHAHRGVIKLIKPDDTRPRSERARTHRLGKPLIHGAQQSADDLGVEPPEARVHPKRDVRTYDKTIHKIKN